MLRKIKNLVTVSICDGQSRGNPFPGKHIARVALLTAALIPAVWMQQAAAQQSGGTVQHLPADRPARLDLPPNVLGEVLPLPVALTPQSPQATIDTMALGAHVRQVLDRHPGLLRMEAGSRAAEYRIEELKGARYPQLVVAGDLGRERRDRPGLDNEDFDRAQAQLRVVMPLYDPEANARIAQQQSAVVSVGWQLTDKREQLILQTIEAYIGLTRATRLLGLARDSLKTHRTYVAQQKNTGKQHPDHAVGMSASIARVALAEATLTRYLLQLESARATWRQLTGLQAPDTIGDVPLAALPDTLDDALAQAAQGNPEIKQAQADMMYAKDAAGLARASYKPRVNLEMRTRNGHDWDGRSGHQARHYAGVTVEWKAFDGFAGKYASKAAQEEILAAQYAFDEQHQALRMRIEQEWFNVQASDVALQSYKAYVEQAGVMVDAGVHRIRQGQGRVLDLLDAEKELFTARVQREMAYHDLVLSSWRLLALQGRIQSVLVH